MKSKIRSKDEMNAQHSARSWRLWIWLFIVLGLLAIPFLYIAFLQMMFEVRMSRIRAAGDPTSIAEVERDRKPSPAEDCTSLWLQAMNAYSADWNALPDEERKKYLALPCIDCGDPIPSPDAAWPELPTAIQCLKSQERALAFCEEATRKGGKASLPRNVRGPNDFGLLAQSGDHRMLYWLVEIRAAVELYQHQSEQAADSIGILFALARSIENQPTFAEGLHSNKIQSAAYHLILELCSQPDVSTESLRHFEEQLKSDDLLRHHRWGFASERAYAADVFFRRLPALLAYGPARSNYLDMMDEMCLLCEAGWPETLRFATSKKSKSYDGLTEMARDACKSMLPSSARVESGRRLTLVAVAARRFLAENHRPPASIEELIPNYLHERPTDVYGNDTVRLASSESEVVISSMAPSKASKEEPVSKPANLEIRFRISVPTTK